MIMHTWIWRIWCVQMRVTGASWGAVPRRPVNLTLKKSLKKTFSCSHAKTRVSAPVIAIKSHHCGARPADGVKLKAGPFASLWGHRRRCPLRSGGLWRVVAAKAQCFTASDLATVFTPRMYFRNQRGVFPFGAAVAVSLSAPRLIETSCMGCGASQQAATNPSSAAPPTATTKKAPMATVDHLNILLQEDLTIRG